MSATFIDQNTCKNLLTELTWFASTFGTHDFSGQLAFITGRCNSIGPLWPRAWLTQIDIEEPKLDDGVVSRRDLVAYPATFSKYKHHR